MRTRASFRLVVVNKVCPLETHPLSPDGHAVIVDVDVPLVRAGRAGALPRVRRAAEQVCRPLGSVLEVAGLAQVTLVQAAGVAGGVGCHRSREHCTHGESLP